MSIKFRLPNNVDTDIVAHSYNGFPVATPEDFLGYLNALASIDPAMREAFFAGHPAARRFFERRSRPRSAMARRRITASMHFVS